MPKQPLYKARRAFQNGPFGTFLASFLSFRGTPRPRVRTPWGHVEGWVRMHCGYLLKVPGARASQCTSLFLSLGPCGGVLCCTAYCVGAALTTAGKVVCCTTYTRRRDEGTPPCSMVFTSHAFSSVLSSLLGSFSLFGALFVPFWGLRRSLFGLFSLFSFLFCGDFWGK